MDVYLPALQKTVSVRGLKVKEMDLMADRTKAAKGQNIETILKDCLLTEGYDVSSMLACDRNEIFFGIRRATYGDEYDFNATCPACDQRSLYGVNLADLPRVEGNMELVKAQIEDPKCMHEFYFAEADKTAHWQFSTGKDLAKGIDIRRRQGHQLYTANLLMRIKAVDKLPEGMNLKQFITEELTAGDVDAFMEYYRECEPGYDELIDLVCQNGMCSADFQVRMPIDHENFFKRSTRKKI